MTTAAISIDHEIVRDSFRQWHAEQEELDAQLAESVAALEAYQSHLDQWQRQLAEERDELHQLRETIERDQAFAGNSGEHVDQLQSELSEARERVARLDAELLARTDELQESNRQRVETDSQLAQAKEREQELVASLESQKRSAMERQIEAQAPVQPRGQVESAAAAQASEPPPAATVTKPRQEPERSANPVLGSVIEQFGKLRQQRAAGRQNHSKPR